MWFLVQPPRLRGDGDAAGHHRPPGPEHRYAEPVSVPPGIQQRKIRPALRTSSIHCKSGSHNSRPPESNTELLSLSQILQSHPSYTLRVTDLTRFGRDWRI